MKKSPKERWRWAGRGVRVMSFSVLCPLLIHGWSMNCHLRFLQSFCLNYIVRPATKTTSQYMQFFLLALLCPVSWKLSPSMNCPVGSVSVLALFSYLVLCCRWTTCSLVLTEMWTVCSLLRKYSTITNYLSDQRYWNLIYVLVFIASSDTDPHFVRQDINPLLEKQIRIPRT